ncbi:AfsR/SARP family transcriptional regulator [Fodinicola acaciae]|uniref:AfsR/SARP family transcriptional regulator n=1 Tax=Fodinicola acaciae TaxID=2681555 RepID=UPI0013D7D8A5|nr:AfsR/SARP family transcriptional regulator [Fodinicola acaciae]
MRFGLLGPFEAFAQDRPISVRGNNNRVILAGLLVNVNHPISSERIASWLWSDRGDRVSPAPPRRVANVRTYVQRIRQQLPDEILRTTVHGYAVRADPDCIDLHRFARLLALGRRAQLRGDHAEAVMLFTDAIAAWRGPALDDIDSPALHEELAVRLGNDELMAHQQRAESLLTLGRHREVVTELARLVRRHPLREPLVGCLMTAHYRCGDRAAAVAQFEATRRALRENLGIDPSNELQRLHVRILRADPTLDLPLTIV